MSLFDFSTHIAKLKKERRFSDALAYFKANKAAYTSEQIATNEYLVSDMLYCLRGASYFDAGFKFLSVYKVEITNNTSERILSAYGWLLWSKYKAENSQNDMHQEAEGYHFDDDESGDLGQFNYQKSDLVVRIERLVPLLFEKNTDFSKSVISNLFNIVLKSEKNKPSPSWQLVDDFCNHFSPEKLSTECRTIKVQRKGREKDMELASDKEGWYAYKTKALQKLGRWQECFDISKQALEVISQFHYSNDVWFSRRIALSKKNLGSPDETIEELLTILGKKREWFIQKELAELYLEKNNIEMAYNYAMDAVNNFGPLEFKIDLLFLMGRIFLSQGKTELAFKHFSLSKLVREKQDPPWKIPQKLHDELRQFDSAEIGIIEIEALKEELNRGWGEHSPARKDKPKGESGSGVVKVILHDNDKGKDGFLTSENSDYYFNVNADNSLNALIKDKSKVVFQVLPSNQPNKPRARIVKVID